MNIKDRLVRKSPEDVIAVGQAVEKAYNGTFGEILRAYINGKTTEALRMNQHNPTDRMPLSADRILGRLEGYTNVLIDLEFMIEEKNQLLEEVKDKKEDEE